MAGTYVQPTAGQTAKAWSEANAGNGFSASYGPGADDWTWDASAMRFGPGGGSPAAAGQPGQGSAPAPVPNLSPVPPGGAGTGAAAGTAPDALQPLQVMARQQIAKPAGFGQEPAADLNTMLTDRELPASGRALQQLAATRGGRIY